MRLIRNPISVTLILYAVQLISNLTDTTEQIVNTQFSSRLTNVHSCPLNVSNRPMVIGYHLWIAHCDWYIQV
jgi:hypothetical protein